MFLPRRNSATEMFVNLRIIFLYKMLRINIFGFRSRVTTSYNQLLSSLRSAHCSVYSKLWACCNKRVMMQIVCFWYSLSIISTCNIYIYSLMSRKYIFRIECSPSTRSVLCLVLVPYVLPYDKRGLSVIPDSSANPQPT